MHTWLYGSRAGASCEARHTSPRVPSMQHHRRCVLPVQRAPQPRSSLVCGSQLVRMHGLSSTGGTCSQYEMGTGGTQHAQ